MDHKAKKVEKHKKAIEEALRFIRAAENAIFALQEDNLAYMTGCKETGAAKRASMDLTRSLAELRKP